MGQAARKERRGWGWALCAGALLLANFRVAIAQEETPFGSAFPIDVHGFVSQGAIKTTENNYLANSERGSLEFTEVGINFTKSLTDELRAGVQLFARDLGPIGNYDAQFDWFYLDYRFFDWLGIRAGRTKLPFGLYNETNDIDMVRVPILLPQSTYPIQNRDFLLAQTGFELYGSIPLAGVSALEYRAYGGTIFFELTDPSSDPTTISVPYIVGGRLMWRTPLDGLRAGGSVQAVRLDAEIEPTPETLEPLETAGLLPADFDGVISVELPALLWIGSVEYAAHDLLLAAEYGRWHVDLDSSLPAVYPPGLTVSERYHAMASYRVVHWFTPGIYYSGLFANVEDRSGRDAYQHDIAVTLRSDINDHWLVKAEGHYMHGTAALSPALNDGASRTSLAPDWGLFLLKTTAYF